MPRDPRLQRIVIKLLEEIPAPYRPPPKPTKSWKGLPLGKRVRHQGTNEEYLITETDNQGVWLTRAWPSVSAVANRLEDPEWTAHYRVLKKREWNNAT